MTDHEEAQIDLVDEAMDNYPGRRAVVGAARRRAGIFRQLNGLTLAQEQRGLLAADLLRGGAGSDNSDQWLEIANKALAAATVIYPDPKEYA